MTSYLYKEYIGDIHAYNTRITLISNSVWNPYSDSAEELENRMTSSISFKNLVGQYMLSDYT